jgi:hypothetical protein
MLVDTSVLDFSEHFNFPLATDGGWTVLPRGFPSPPKHILPTERMAFWQRRDSARSNPVSAPLGAPGVQLERERRPKTRPLGVPNSPFAALSLLCQATAS